MVDVGEQPEVMYRKKDEREGNSRKLKPKGTLPLVIFLSRGGGIRGLSIGNFASELMEEINNKKKRKGRSSGCSNTVKKEGSNTDFERKKKKREKQGRKEVGRLEGEKGVSALPETKLEGGST